MIKKKLDEESDCQREQKANVRPDICRTGLVEWIIAGFRWLVQSIFALALAAGLALLQAIY